MTETCDYCDEGLPKDADGWHLRVDPDDYEPTQRIPCAKPTVLVSESSRELVVPYTGELIALEDPEQCARVLYEIGELEAKIRALRHVLRGVMFEESVRVGSKTLHFPDGVTAKVITPTETSWDHSILAELLGAGLPGDRFEALVTPEQTFKVNGSIVKELEAANPIYAEIIERARTKIPKSPGVTLTKRPRVDYDR